MSFHATLTVSMFKLYGITEVDLITNDDHEKTVDYESCWSSAVQKEINGLSQNVSLVATLNISSLKGARLRFKLRPERGEWQCRSRNRIRKIYRWPPSTL